MMPNITRGGSTAGLMVYLFGVGKKNEHTDQHVITGDAGLVREFLGAQLDTDYALDVANYLDEPMKTFGVSVNAPVKRWDPEAEKNVVIGQKPAHMWHCSLSLSADEGTLTDEQWANIAQDFVREMGYDSGDAADSACRWVAVRHGESTAGNDHVHIAVNLVREDGTKASVHNDFRRAQATANALEHKYGLRVLASREEGQELPRGNKPAELDRAREIGRATDRDELRRRLRGVAVASVDERDFITRAREARVLVRPRFERDTAATRVVGYSVALTPVVGADGVRPQPVWFAGSKLDATLGLGQLRARWQSTPEAEAGAVELWRERGTAARSGRDDVPAKTRPERLPRDVVERLNAHGQNVVPARGARFDRAAAIDMSGAFAQASMYFERGTHGPMAEASDVFARAAARDRYTAARGGSRSGGGGEAAAYSARLMVRATGSNSATGWIAVFRQLERVGRVLESERRTAGQAATATAMRRAVAGAVRAFEDATAPRPLSDTDRARMAPEATRRDVSHPRTSDRDDRGRG